MYLEVLDASSGYEEVHEANVEVMEARSGVCMCRREEGCGGAKGVGIWM